MKANISIKKLHSIDYEIYDQNIPIEDIENGIYIEDIFVQKENRGRGFGTLALKEIIEQADKEGKYVFLQVYPYEFKAGEDFEKLRIKGVEWHKQFNFVDYGGGWMARKPKIIFMKNH